jgi:hypothetical protein
MLIALGENQFGQKFLTETCSVRSHEEATMAENTFNWRWCDWHTHYFLKQRMQNNKTHSLCKSRPRIVSLTGMNK